MSAEDDAVIQRDECWFLCCTRSPDGVLHGDNGFSVAACENHGKTGESLGWEQFNMLEEDDAAE